MSGVPDVIISAKFYVNWLRGFSGAAPPKVPFPILIRTTLTTVLHYRADCDVTLDVPVKFWTSSGSEVRFLIPDTDSGSGLDSPWRRCALSECSSCSSCDILSCRAGAASVHCTHVFVQVTEDSSGQCLLRLELQCLLCLSFLMPECIREQCCSFSYISLCSNI